MKNIFHIKKSLFIVIAIISVSMGGAVYAASSFANSVNPLSYADAHHFATSQYDNRKTKSEIWSEADYTYSSELANSDSEMNSVNLETSSQPQKSSNSSSISVSSQSASSGSQKSQNSVVSESKISSNVSSIASQSAASSEASISSSQAQSQAQNSQNVIQPVKNTGTTVINSLRMYADPNYQGNHVSKIGGQPIATWFGGWNQNIYNDVNSLVNKASEADSTALMVLYNIPSRDCGGYSAGGSNTEDGYRSWITNAANAIGARKAFVILEPDALPGMDCLDSTGQSIRLNLLKQAVHTLKSQSSATVFIDAGHSNWKSSGEMITRLNSAGIAEADGFSLNISNYIATNQAEIYGERISGGVHKPYVIDTSRNGNGANGEWCNPRGRALGEQPTSNTNSPNALAYLWVKAPGESDGSCNGGPNAGMWWEDIAQELSRNAHF